MSERRTDILNAALALFNEHGLDQITTREIAKQINISLGNLTYYFPSKNEIVLALLHQCIEEVDAALANHNKEARNTLVKYVEQVEIIFTTQLHFKFIFNKRYGEILTSLPDMQKHYQEVLKKRFDFFQQMNEQLVKEKLVTPSLLEESFAHSYVINILALFWHQELSIYFPKFNDKQKVQHALAVFFQSYKPYLTKKGLGELMPLLKKLEHY